MEGPFHFECDLSIQQSPSNTLVKRLKSFRSRTDLASFESDQAVKGKLSLDSGENIFSSFASKGIGRYAIQTTSAVTLELTIAFWLEEEAVQETVIDQDILRYCEAGDYLTFYVKGETFPVSIDVAF